MLMVRSEYQQNYSDIDEVTEEIVESPKDITENLAEVCLVDAKVGTISVRRWPLHAHDEKDRTFP